jgi:hypothetical protein
MDLSNYLPTAMASLFVVVLALLALRKYVPNWSLMDDEVRLLLLIEVGRVQNKVDLAADAVSMLSLFSRLLLCQAQDAYREYR